MYMAVLDRRGMDWPGRLWTGLARLSRCGVARSGWVRLWMGEAVLVWSGAVGFGMARLSRHGTARFGLAWYSRAVVERLGTARPGL